MIGVEGIIFALLSSSIEMCFDLDPEHREYSSDGLALWLVQLLGRYHRVRRAPGRWLQHQPQFKRHGVFASSKAS